MKFLIECKDKNYLNLAHHWLKNLSVRFKKHTFEITTKSKASYFPDKWLKTTFQVRTFLNNEKT